MKNKFDKISISGRYIYAYLSIVKYMKIKNCKFFPKELDELLKNFVSTDRLDDWHENIEEIYPSIILSNTYESGYFEFISIDFYNLLKEYYYDQGTKLYNMIELLLDLGASNIYSSFKSETSLKYLIEILKILEQENVEPISYEIIKDCSVQQKKGWGDYTNIDDYHIDY